MGAHSNNPHAVPLTSKSSLTYPPPMQMVLKEHVDDGSTLAHAGIPPMGWPGKPLKVRVSNQEQLPSQTPEWKEGQR